MYVVIVGAGKVGSALVHDISLEGHDVTVIDINQKVIDHMQTINDVGIVHGNGACCSVQEEAEAYRADLVIAVTASDEVNILCCMVSRRLGAKNTVARVRNPEYLAQMSFMSEQFGISMLINPENETANEIVKMLSFPAAMKIDSFAKGHVEMAEIRLGSSNPYNGKTIRDAVAQIGLKLLICAVTRGSEVFIPNGEFVLEAGDRLHVTASRSVLIGLVRRFGSSAKNTKIKNVMIVGGGRVGYYLAMQLGQSGVNVKIIEADEVRCELLSDSLPKAQVIFGDGTDEEVLLEQGINNQDAFVSLTGIDEENVIISMYANTQKVEKVVCKVNRLSSEMLGTIGIDSVVSPKNLVTNKILRYVRAINNDEGNGIQTLYKFSDGKFEALEFIVDDGFEEVGVTLKDMHIKKDILIACIIRNGKVIFPTGADVLEAGDSVIVVTTISQLDNLYDILA